MAEKQSKWRIFTAGIIRENPVLRLVLGCCSALAVTTTVSGALGMGLAMTFVLVCSNIVISALRKVIPAKVHLPCYIVIIATFVTIVQMVLQAYVPALYKSLGVFLALIVVNCIILGRAEMFACKNSVVDSALDGLGMGCGYILTMLLMSSVREILGNGTWMGITIIPESIDRMSLMNVPLLERLIEIFTDKGDVVIDPCAGSGTTLLAAANMGRKAYGFEIKKDFCAEARVKVLPRISKSLFV